MSDFRLGRLLRWCCMGSDSSRSEICKISACGLEMYACLWGSSYVLLSIVDTSPIHSELAGHDCGTTMLPGYDCGGMFSWMRGAA